MKVRIQGNSIRYRLKQFEVEALAQKKTIIEELKFSNDQSSWLRFILQPSFQKQPDAGYKNGELVVSIPENEIEMWASSSQVGIESEIPVKNGQAINILIEKDFKCLNESEEDSEGSYPNPMKAC